MAKLARAGHRGQILRQALRFGIVGVANTATCVVLIWLLTRSAHQPVWLASALGYGLATAQSYALNRLWTFAGRAATAPLGPQAAAFIGVNLLCGASFAVLNEVGSRFLGLLGATVVAIAIVTPLSFALIRQLVFRQSRTRTS